MELGERSLLVYRTIVRVPGLDTAGIAEHTGLGEAVVDGEVERLTRAGLLGTYSTPATLALAVDPEIGLALLAERASWELQQRLDEVEQANRAISALLAELSRPGGDDGLVAVEPPSTAARQELLIRHSRERVAVLLRPGGTGDLAGLAASAEAMVGAAGRGVAFRVLVDESLLSEPELLALAGALDRAAEWRQAQRLPVGLILVDDESAILHGDVAANATFVGTRTTVLALASLFENLWDGAPAADTLDAVVPAGGRAAPAGAGADDQDRLIRLMATGLKDDAIARHLGVSVRTLTRMIGALQADLSSLTRFQAGAEAARRGLL